MHHRRHIGFHPSKEGFKGIPDRCPRPRAPSFHPSKEGFKAIPGLGPCIRETGFHPSKEGFKGRCKGPRGSDGRWFPSL